MLNTTVLSKEEVLSKLNDTLKKMKELDPKKFNYAHFVTECDLNKVCGTVCCILGWYPLWFPESGFKWIVPTGVVIKIKLRFGENEMEDIELASLAYHSISSKLNLILFYGDRGHVNSKGVITLDRGNDISYPYNTRYSIGVGNAAKLPEVIELWEQVIDMISTDKLRYT